MLEETSYSTVRRIPRLIAAFTVPALMAVAHLLPGPAAAQNARHIDARDGLSHSGVICMTLDSDHHLWIGTYDGLNRYDGYEVKVYTPDAADPHSISGNVVRRIVESRGRQLWILTKGGLNRFSMDADRVEQRFGDFAEDSDMTTDREGNFYILTRTGFLFHYDFESGRMRELAIPDLRPTAEWVNFVIDTDDTAWVTTGGVVRRYRVERSGGEVPRFVPLGQMEHPRPVTHIFHDRGTVIFIDGGGDLFTLRGGVKTSTRNVSDIFSRWGDVSAASFDGEDIVLGLRTSGAARLKRRDGWAEERLAVGSGVFSLLKDDRQDVLWIGTDGEGVWQFTRERWAFRGIALDELPLEAHRPVRAVWAEPDAAGGSADLWLGTKGSGIVRIDGYRTAAKFDGGNVTRITTADGLADNSVYALLRSGVRDVLWIGSDGPRLNYYSFDDGRVHTLHTPVAATVRVARASPDTEAAGGAPQTVPATFPTVHSMHEDADGTLWVSSVYSLYRLKIVPRAGGGLEATEVVRWDFDVRDRQVFNRIFDICPDGDSVLWLAMRGNGAIRFDKRTGEARLHTFGGAGFVPMDDILSVHRDGRGEMWFGSNYGISRLVSDGKHVNYNTDDGLANNTVHGILEGEGGDLWFSTNAGLSLYDRRRGTFRNFDARYSLKATEFSDNAYFRDEGSGKLFFGGTAGVVWIEPGEGRDAAFVPPVTFTGLDIAGEMASLHDRLVRRRDGVEFLRLGYHERTFSVSFSVGDFTGRAAGDFAYKLAGAGDVWMHTRSREVQFTGITPGSYTLSVRYGDGLGENSPMASLPIVIRPPWWGGVWAWLFYLLVGAGAVVCVVVWSGRRQRLRREKLAEELSRQYREQVYENKLHFFTNITHELCTPLALIHTPGERLLEYAGSDDYVRRYARMIVANSERLNNIVQEIINFRRVETGHKQARIAPCDIGALCREVTGAFADVARRQGIELSLNVATGLVWNTDGGCVTTILNNLVSNAFKYTEPRGEVTVSAVVEEGRLLLSVYNTGRGIAAEDVPRIFDQYTVLDNVEHNTMEGISTRNGLGLPIVRSMAGLLGGTVDVASEPGRYARFMVRLSARELPAEYVPEPSREASPGISTAVSDTVSNVVSAVADTHAAPHLAHDGNSSSPASAQPQTTPVKDPRPKVLIVDDNDDILFTLREILSDEYAVAEARDGREGLELLHRVIPDIVLTDVMMPDVDGISLTREIKRGNRTMHIPVVIVSARSTTADRIEGIGSGADGYIAKPFDVAELKVLVDSLVARHRKLRDYYLGLSGTHDRTEGYAAGREESDFLRAMCETIDRNIISAGFGAEDLADAMNIGLRTLYRRFKELRLPAPGDFIRRRRIEYAARLLVGTSLTVQEVMFTAGFATRSNFYNEFMRRYGRSPSEYRAAEQAALEKELGTAK